MPGDKEIAERRSAGKGLTNPELALLLAHTKIAATEEALASGLGDDPYLHRELTEYFPAPLRATQPGRMGTHPLRREIITTSVVNEMVDTSGITFTFRLNRRPARRFRRSPGPGWWPGTCSACRPSGARSPPWTARSTSAPRSRCCWRGGS